MFNPFQAMQMISNPAGTMSNAMQNQLLATMNQMAQQNPQAFQKMQEMTNGKNADSLKSTAMNLAKQKGINLNEFASQFGIKL